MAQSTTGQTKAIEPVKVAGLSLLDQVVPPSSTPAKAAPTLYDSFKGIWAVAISSGALFGVLEALERSRLQDYIPNPTVGAIVGAIVNIAVVVARQYGGGPKPPAGYR